MKILKLTILILLIGLTNRSYSCSCIIQSLEANIKSAKIIVKAEVINTESITYNGRFYTVGYLEIKQLLKNSSDSSIQKRDTIKIYTPTSNCGLGFQKGAQYIIFTSPRNLEDIVINNESTIMSANICNGSQGWGKPAKKNLKKIKQHLRKDE